MRIIDFSLYKRQPHFVPICLIGHRCEIIKWGCHFLVYHGFNNNGISLSIFWETSSVIVRPLGLMLVSSVFTLEVSYLYSFRDLGYNFSNRLYSCPMYLFPFKGMYDRSERLLVLIQITYARTVARLKPYMQGWALIKTLEAG